MLRPYQRNTMAGWIKSLKNLKKYLWELTRNMIDPTKNKQGFVIMIATVESADANAVTTKVERWISWQYMGRRKADKPSREFKPSPSRFFNVVHGEVTRKFDTLLDRADKKPLDCLEVPVFVLPDLALVQEHYASTNHQPGMTEELPEPQLLEGNEQGPLDKYLKLVRTNLIKWTNNVMVTATTELVECQTAAEKNSDELCHM
ncbi:hypothetical protein EDD11_002745 [Mortierella claussenii]|nr:hypothetical protein EDD11_002745 [Mortierella claussenii]